MVNHFKTLIKKMLRSKGLLLVKINDISANKSEYNLIYNSNSQLDLINKFQLELSSVLHIGAHFGEEAQQYWDKGIRKVTFVEADPETFKICERNISKFSGFIAICALLTNSINQTHRFYISSNDGMSSSVLKPGRHLLEHPDITFDSSKYIIGHTLDSLKLQNHDLVVIDVQGAEDLVILGGMQTIGQAKYLFIEVNSGELYINDASITKLINLLDENFVLINLEMNNHYYGDAFFINKRCIDY